LSWADNSCRPGRAGVLAGKQRRSGQTAQKKSRPRAGPGRRL